MDKTGIKDRIVIKGRRIIVTALLQEKAINQLHLNPMSIEKTIILACESTYGTNMYTDIEVAIKSCPHMS